MLRRTSTLALLLALASQSPSASAQDPDPRADATEPAAKEEEHEYDFRHPLGIRLDHAEGWRVQETALGLQLTPPDPVVNATGPAELHLVAMIGADPEVRSLDDPLAFQKLALLMQSQLPFLAPRGKAQPVAGRPDARRYDFQGRSPYGPELECRVYGMVFEGWFVSVTTLAEPALVARREAALLEVVKSLVLAEPEADPVLAGTWHSQSFSRAGDVREYVNTSSTTSVTMTANGRLRSSTSTAVFGQTGRDDGAGGTINGQTGALLEDGRWARKGDALWVVWRAGGASRFELFVQGQPGRREMLLTPAGGGQKVLWTEYVD